MLPDLEVEPKGPSVKLSPSDLYANLYACNMAHGIPEANARINWPYDSQLKSKLDTVDWAPTSCLWYASGKHRNPKDVAYITSVMLDPIFYPSRPNQRTGTSVTCSHQSKSRQRHLDRQLSSEMFAWQQWPTTSQEENKVGLRRMWRERSFSILENEGG